MKRILLASLITLVSCGGPQRPSTQDICRDVAIGTSALDVLINTLATTLPLDQPVDNVLAAVDAIDQKVHQGAAGCSGATRSERASVRLRRMLDARRAAR